MKTKLIFALVAALSSNAFAALETPLPEFKNDKQLAEWRAEKASKSNSHGYAAEESAFYTGKPYIESSSGYAFKYRSYNPELARWTSEDPSGFPDGANVYGYVKNRVTNFFDYEGLASASFKGAYNDASGFNVVSSGEFIYELDANFQHFTKHEGKWLMEPMGVFKNSAGDVLSNGSIFVGSSNGVDFGVKTVMINQQSMKVDWIVITAYYNIVSAGGTTRTQVEAAHQRFEGNPYE